MTPKTQFLPAPGSNDGLLIFGSLLSWLQTKVAKAA